MYLGWQGLEGVLSSLQQSARKVPEHFRSRHLVKACEKMKNVHPEKHAHRAVSEEDRLHFPRAKSAVCLDAPHGKCTPNFSCGKGGLQSLWKRHPSQVHKRPPHQHWTFSSTALEHRLVSAHARLCGSSAEGEASRQSDFIQAGWRFLCNPPPPMGRSYLSMFKSIVWLTCNWAIQEHAGCRMHGSANWPEHYSTGMRDIQKTWERNILDQK